MKCPLCRNETKLLEIKNDALIKCTNCTWSIKEKSKEKTVKYFEENS